MGGSPKGGVPSYFGTSEKFRKNTLSWRGKPAGAKGESTKEQEDVTEIKNVAEDSLLLIPPEAGKKESSTW